jgi:hypothetical protein
MTDNDPSGEIPSGQTAADVPLDLLPVVELTDDQYERAEQLAHRRDKSYDSIDGGRVYGTQTSADVHCTGVVGELAYAIKNGLCIDESVYEYGDAGYDLTDGGVTIDTKTTWTQLDRPDLIVPVEPSPAADLFVLLHRIGPQTVRIVGTATYAEVVDREPEEKPGNDLNFVVPQSELRLPRGLARQTSEGQSYA